MMIYLYSTVGALLHLGSASAFGAHAGWVLSSSTTRARASLIMSSNMPRDLFDPPSLAHTLKAAATMSALQRTTHTNSSDVDAAATLIALDICEKTAALLRAQLVDSGDAYEAAPPPAVDSGITAASPAGAAIAPAIFDSGDAYEAAPPPPASMDSGIMAAPSAGAAIAPAIVDSGVISSAAAGAVASAEAGNYEHLQRKLDDLERNELARREKIAHLQRNLETEMAAGASQPPPPQHGYHFEL